MDDQWIINAWAESMSALAATFLRVFQQLLVEIGFTLSCEAASMTHSPECLVPLVAITNCGNCPCKKLKVHSTHKCKWH